jgi:protease PrsW
VSILNAIPSPDSVPVAPLSTQNRRKIGLTLTLGFVLLGLVFLVMARAEVSSRNAFVIGALTAIVPVPFYLALVLWSDRFEPEPVRQAAFAFFWGATFAVVLAFLVNSIGGMIVSARLGKDAAEVYGGSISAPIVEESCKAAVLFLLFFKRRRGFNGIHDGIFYAAMVGLGFAMSENILYYGHAAEGHAVLSIFIMRGLLAPFAHPVFTAMTGLGLGLALQSRNARVRRSAPIAGLLGAITLHSIWNSVAGSASSPATVIHVYLFLFLPVFAGIVGVIVYSLRRESEIIARFLPREFFDEKEIARLASFRLRVRDTIDALKEGGFAGWRKRDEYERAASELAFERFRALESRDLPTEINQVEKRYATRLRALQDELVAFDRASQVVSNANVEHRR